ncbi:hypothetical protein ACOMHN_016834 [Nucella lapillus]
MPLSKQSLGEQRVPEGSSADWEGYNSRKVLNSLPDLVICNIFRYLYWKEKIYAAEVFPHWERVLNSCLGWERFENDRGYAHGWDCLTSKHYVLEEVSCITQYGRYFSHCHVWIHNFLPMESPVDTDFSLLKYIELYCPRLKSLSIYHPPNLSSSALTLSYVQYVLPLQNIVTSENRVHLHLHRLLYTSVESSTGVVDLLHFYQTHNLLRKICSLDFSHGLILASSVQPLNILMICSCLRFLKCPIQNLTTTIIQQLLNRNLEELYLVNDEHTLNLNFVEKSSIKWTLLRLRSQCQLKVHYIFKNRAVCPIHICPNPYAQSLVLDSLCSSVSRALLRSIADTYKQSLQCLAFILSVWEPLVPFSDLEDLASNFQYLAERLVKLHSIILNLIIPSDAVVAMALHSPSLTNFLIYEHKIFFDGKVAMGDNQMSDLKREVSQALGQPWAPVAAEDSIYRLACYKQNLLFEENVHQWEGFW